MAEECKRRHPCTILVEICRKLKLSEPSYATSETETTGVEPLLDDSKKFQCKCVLSDLRCFSVGYGKNKKAAKFEAAKKTI